MNRKTRSDKVAFDDKDIRKIESMSAMGLSIEQIASIFNISTDTIYRRMKEGNIDLSAALSKGKSKAIYKIANKAYQLALEGSPSMIKYFLSCRGNWSEKSQITVETEQVEDKGPSKFEQALDKMSDEEFEKVQSLNEEVIKIVDQAFDREIRPDAGWWGMIK
jgi:hypothetical protein